MWQGLDPELLRELATLKRLVTLTRQTPTSEWPLVYVAEHDALLVVREWPNGDITAYAATDVRSQP
jgi:hypothetical protein